MIALKVEVESYCEGNKRAIWSNQGFYVLYLRNPYPNLALANATKPAIVFSSLARYSLILSSLSSFLALRISSFRISLSFFFLSNSVFRFLKPSIPSSPPSNSFSATSSTPPASVLADAKARLESAFSRFFSRMRSLLPGSARGRRSSRCAFWSLRSERRSCWRVLRWVRESSWLDS